MNRCNNTILKNDLDDFLAINGQPRAYKIASVQATKELKQLFTDATHILENKLNNVMKIFKRRDTNFYNVFVCYIATCTFLAFKILIPCYSAGCYRKGTSMCIHDLQEPVFGFSI